MKPHKRNGREAKLRRQEAAKGRQEKSQKLLTEVLTDRFKKEKSS